MKKHNILPVVALLALIGTAKAADTDLFLNNPTVTGSKPNVLFFLDNSANWNATLYKVDSVKVTKKDVVHRALHHTLTNSALTDTIRTGIMAFANGNSPKGGKVIAAVKELTASYQSTLDSLIYDGSWNELLPGTNNAPYALTLNEAYRYFAGLTPRSGTEDSDYDPSALDTDGNYISPALDITNTCAKNYIILIGNGGPDSGENNDAENVLTGLGGKLPTDPITLSPDNFESNWGDEFARYMAGIDLIADQGGQQNIVTYVIDVYDPSQLKTPGDYAERAYLKSIAKQGRGRYFTASNETELEDAINNILNEIQAVDSVFASTTLPVSVNVRGTNLNQVYMGVFRPDPNAYPRWFGNLKLYQLAVDSATDTLFLADKNNQPAESPTTGFIVSDAVSFWTTPSSFWTFAPRGTPPSGSESPDGEVVEMGAAAQHLRAGTTTRNIYTCISTGCSTSASLSTMPFTTTDSAITTTALGAADSTERDNIINWVRGIDNKEDENSDGSYTDIRASVHGDVLHSKPAVINYNRDGSGSGDIVAFYGANDGVFHAVKGGKSDTDGYEMWGFIPEEFFGSFKRLYDNAPDINTTPKPFFADGTIGVYREDVNNDGKLVAADGDKVYLFLSMRRGGRFIYALDVSDPTNPKFLWKRDNSSTGYGELGETWSEPKYARINLGGTAKDVLIFGAGYDETANDASPQGTATQGRGILVVDAGTGDVIWEAGPAPSGAAHNKTVSDMLYSIPSDITVLNRDGDINNYADRLYVGDTGGNLWRVDISDTDPSNWTVSKLAAVGGNRKFLYPPDVVYSSDANGNYDAILIGSGDREHPFDTTVTNRFYMFKDRGPSTNWPLDESQLYDATANLLQVGTATEQAAASALLTADAGWYITLGSGEKVVGNAVTVAGTTFFNTNQPALAVVNSCTSNLGIARNYAVSYEDATSTTELNGISGLTTDDRSSVHPGGGFPPSPVPVIVEINGKKYQAVVSGTKVMSPPNVKLEHRSRIYWYKEFE